MKAIGSLLNTLFGLAIVGGLGFLLYKTGTEWKKGGTVDDPPFVRSYQEARELAIKEHKPMVLIFSASWCPPCRQMKKNVYPSASVKAYHDKFVWAYLDVDIASNQPAAQQFGVNGIPHIVGVKADGTRLFTQVGGSNPAAFALQLQTALARN
jgi:thioredoxin-related protein